MPVVEVFIPVPPRTAAATVAAAAASTSLRGRTIGILNNGWGSMDELATFIERELCDAYGVTEVIHFRNDRKAEPASPEFLDDIAARVAGAITGLGN